MMLLYAVNAERLRHMIDIAATPRYAMLIDAMLLAAAISRY